MIYGAGKYKYELVDEWAKYPEGWSFVDVPSISIDSQDNVYVISRGDHPVMAFNREGSLLTSWGEELFNRPHGSCVGHDGFIYCTDEVHHVVYKFTLEGRLIMTLGNKDKPSDTGYVRKSTVLESLPTIERGGPPFNRPTSVALSSSGEIYVSDGYGNARVHKFAYDGTLLFSWGEPGDGPGQFRIPHCIWVDKQDRGWVTDRENNRIQIFDTQGKFIDQITDLIRPNNFCIDSQGVVYVAELPRRVSIFTPDGSLLARWSCEGEFSACHAIAVDSRGDIYIGDITKKYGVDRGTKTVRKFVKRS